jgi:cysteine desulfurase
VTEVIYLDNHASTQVDPRVLDAMLPYLTSEYGNPASLHAYGMRAEQAIQTARQQAAVVINANSEEIFFTSGATESNNLVIKGVYDHFRDKKPHFIMTAVEHKCVLEGGKYIKQHGAEVTVLPVDKDGRVKSTDVISAIRTNTVLVSIMHGNNEIGSINAIGELGRICHERGVLFHTDAAQTLGKIPIDVRAMHIDYLSASAHKIYGPKGVGLIFIRRPAQSQITPLLHGGGQESGLRSGTLNVPGIVGFGKALEIATVSQDADFYHYLSLRDRLYAGLCRELKNITLNGPPIGELPNRDSLTPSDQLTRLPNNLNIVLHDVEISAFKRRVRSVAVSSGSACSSVDQKPSYVLTAIGRTDAEAHASLRFGIGRFNTEQDIDSALQHIVEATRALNPKALRS